MKNENENICKICQKKPARNEAVIDSVYLCEVCYKLPKCQNGDCLNTILCPRAGWHGEPNTWCWECIKRIDEMLDSMQDRREGVIINTIVERNESTIAPYHVDRERI